MADASTVDALAALAGEQREGAWAVLVGRHGPDVWRLIASRSRDAHEAEDAYQEFWLRLPAAAAGFAPGTDGERSARAWLMRVAYTTAIDHLRRRRAAGRRLVPADHDTEAPMPEADAGREAMVARVRSALEAMPEAQRRPLVLHLVAGLSYEELAADLRCTVNNARVKVHRALQHLRQAIGAEGQGLPDSSLAGLLVPPSLLPAALPPVPLPASPPPLGPLAVAAKAPFLAAAGAIAATAAIAGTAWVATRRPPAAEEAPMPVVRPLAATAVAAGSLVAADLLDDFERADPDLMSYGDGVRGTAATVPAPAGLGRGRALRLAWPEPHGEWIDAGYIRDREPPLSLRERRDDAAITLSLWAEPFAGIAYLAIRLDDAGGETFEWRAPIPGADKAGWRTMTVAIVPDHPAGHWARDGVVADGRVDYPLHLKGYALRFTATTVPAGAVVIDDVGTAIPAPVR